ncbi:hypothetical protein MMC31_006640, partial [Peltigera leucophlebia]|nr:hypothetical protein [Peltigera leucophlebia]
SYTQAFPSTSPAQPAPSTREPEQNMTGRLPPTTDQDNQYLLATCRNGSVGMVAEGVMEKYAGKAKEDVQDDGRGRYSICAQGDG